MNVRFISHIHALEQVQSTSKLDHHSASAVIQFHLLHYSSAILLPLHFTHKWFFLIIVTVATSWFFSSPESFAATCKCSLFIPILDNCCTYLLTIDFSRLPRTGQPFDFNSSRFQLQPRWILDCTSVSFIFSSHLVLTFLLLLFIVISITLLLTTSEALIANFNIQSV